MGSAELVKPAGELDGKTDDVKLGETWGGRVLLE